MQSMTDEHTKEGIFGITCIDHVTETSGIYK
jgi:hypothetical protein